MTPKSESLLFHLPPGTVTRWTSRYLLAVCLMTGGCFSRSAHREAKGELKTAASLSVPASWRLPQFDQDFSSHWHDGQSEIAAYRLSIDRYDEKRRGHAVAIFVTEPFSLSRRVKIEDAQRASSPAGDAAEVMKLNLVRDFPTGLYDYNTMSSTFLTMAPSAAGPQGSPLKSTFSSQEWCGHVYASLEPRGNRIVHELRSYFGTEGDRNEVLDAGEQAVLADTLFHWARGWASPVVPPGAKVDIKLFDSLIEMRFGHAAARFASAAMSVAAATEPLAAAGKDWMVRRKEVTTHDGRRYVFWVQEDPPHIVVKWEFTGAAGANEAAVLLGFGRYKYWDMKDEGSRAKLKEIGLDPKAW